MKTIEERKQLRAMEASELAAKLTETEKELMHLHFKLASNQLQQTAQLTVLRRRIARIKTIQTAVRSAAVSAVSGLRRRDWRELRLRSETSVSETSVGQAIKD